MLTNNGGTLQPGTSDARLKTNVASLPSMVDVVKALRPVTYNWIDVEENGSYVELGFIAQEVEEHVPEVVRTPR